MSKSLALSCRDVLRQGAVPSFHPYSGTSGFCPVCGLEVTATNDSREWRTVYRDDEYARVPTASQGARFCINFRGLGSRRIQWANEWGPGASRPRLVYADDFWGVGDKGETVNMDEQGDSGVGGGEYSGGLNQANATAYTAGEAANLTPTIDAEVNGEDETDPAPRVSCRAVHIYGIDGKGYRTARLVMAQEQDDRYNKLTVSEPDGKGGYKTCNIRLDADAWAALKKTFNGYGDESIPAPEKRADKPSMIAKLTRANEQLMKQRSELRAELEKFRGGVGVGRDNEARTMGYERSEDRADAVQERVRKEPIPTAPMAPQAVLRGARGYELPDPRD